MKMTQLGIAALLTCVGVASSANAETLFMSITADNHYALYSSVGTTFTFHGGNELGSGGNPGTYNWSLPETYQFNAGDRVYIAAWSDDSVAQGVLAQVYDQFNNSLHSGDPAWLVYHTNINRGDGDQHPDLIEMAAHVANADAFNLWEIPFVGEANGTDPWGTVPGITTAAKWMWYSAPGDADPLRGGSGDGEMLVFSMRVPAPGSLALAGLGGLCFARRRRS